MEAAMNYWRYAGSAEQRNSDFTSWKTISTESEDSSDATLCTMESTGRKPDGMTIKASYEEDFIMFELPLLAVMTDLVDNVTTRLNMLKDGAFTIKYLDDAGDWVLIACDADLQACMASSRLEGHNMIRMLIQGNPCGKRKLLFMESAMEAAMNNGRYVASAEQICRSAFTSWKGISSLKPWEGENTDTEDAESQFPLYLDYAESRIRQTLTPEVASVLNHSIEEAGRQNHRQTTPLHVAATLLASPLGILRQACIRSCQNSSHPLKCQVLEFCFSVTFKRLPTAQNVSPGMEPPISNALMAVLKRAQTRQWRGCPEQRQQPPPLLAVKVELEHLTMSILDDLSVSRVMCVASFSSAVVKATIEQSLYRNPYLNPRLLHGNSTQFGQQRNADGKRVGTLLRTKNRNPISVGYLEPEVVVKAGSEVESRGAMAPPLYLKTPY